MSKVKDIGIMAAVAGAVVATVEGGKAAVRALRKRSKNGGKKKGN